MAFSPGEIMRHTPEKKYPFTDNKIQPNFNKFLNEGDVDEEVASNFNNLIPDGEAEGQADVSVNVPQVSNYRDKLRHLIDKKEKELGFLNNTDKI